MKTKHLFLMATILISLFSACAQKETITTVPNVDVNKYVGKWYEIAAFPQKFQKGCHCTTAEYTLTDKGYLIVENRCNKDKVDGEQSYIKGKAFIVENSGNAKLKVQFFWPFKGDYWIIDLASDYSYAVVSDPSMKYLWILCRTSKMEESVYQAILTRLVEKGYDLSKLVKTIH